MEYKQFSPEVVIRTEDNVAVPIDDPGFIAWLEAGNSPFPPDPPLGEELVAIVEQLVK